MIASIKLNDRIPSSQSVMGQLSATDLEYIREGCRSSITLDQSVEPRLAEVVSYVLSAEGSMMRAQLGFMSMIAAGAKREEARNFGVAVEYFHTASLLFDDMPAMDNATYRRGMLCAHLKFSEADTTLAALALITHAYDLLFSMMLSRPASKAEAAQKVMTECLGARGILSGQSADVHYIGDVSDGEDVLAIAGGKTGALLRLLLNFPARLCGSSHELVNRLEQLAECWGHAYQVIDDFKDCLNTDQDAGKTVRRDALLDRPNFLIKVGRDKAWRYLSGTLALTKRLVKEISSMDSGWSGLSRLQLELESRVETFAHALKTALSD